MIGDQQSDLQAGIAAGCLKSYLIKPTDSRLALCKQIILTRKLTFLQGK